MLDSYSVNLLSYVSATCSSLINILTGMFKSVWIFTRSASNAEGSH
ncbi:hypothetical protein DFQ12_0846 [Sphingobacterium detergens]|uniref:Uncharacterized protein n=1 Tax=Sphingobacterium detergens TaxID=1145106 RepID=A0A420BH42_SPHD1|nr:hypothetical protein DFQ12_0846 [Sphingobacterium detergens]